MIVADRLSVVAGAFRLDGISFEIPAGGYGILMGKTGCGKTTVLESIIGLRRVRGGRVRLHGADVTERNPAARSIGYVPQDGALFAGMTVRDHLAFALEIRRAQSKLIQRRVAELAELLGIESLLARTPRGLSGGERQRVALGRALSCWPSVLCLDEPLSALDTETRAQMCDLLKSIREHAHVTTLHVTHNLEEAQRLGDCWFRLEAGRVEAFNPSSSGHTNGPPAARTVDSVR